MEEARRSDPGGSSSVAPQVQVEGTHFSSFEPSLLLHHEGLMRLNLWVAKHGALDLTLKQAAQIACLEPHYFSGKFHEYIGVSFKEWRSQHRISWAVQAICFGQSPLSEIVQCAGYRNRRAFEKSVKRYTGTTPGRLRERFRAAGPGQSTLDAKP